MVTEVEHGGRWSEGVRVEREKSEGERYVRREVEEWERRGFEWVGPFFEFSKLFGKVPNFIFKSYKKILQVLFIYINLLIFVYKKAFSLI